MADNSLQNGTDNIATDDLATLNGAASSGVKVERVKVGYGSDGDFRDVDSTHPLPTIEPDTIVANTVLMTATGNTVAVSVGATVGVQISGTWTGTIAFEATTDGTNWFAVNAVSSVLGAMVTTTTANGQWRINAGGYVSVRVRSSVIGTGTASVTLVGDMSPTVVTHAEPIEVRGAAISGTSGTVAAGATGTIGPVDVTHAGSVSFILKPTAPATPWTNNPVVVFEQSDDQVSWAPLQVARSDIGVVSSTHILPVGAANTSQVFEAPMEAINYVRVRVTTGPVTGGMTVVVNSGGGFLTPVTSIASAPRTPVALIIEAYSVTNADALITPTQVVKGTTTTAAAYAVTTGKTLRIQSILITGVLLGITVAATHVRLRANTAGAIALGSPIFGSARLGNLSIGTQAANYGLGPVDISLGDGLELPSGAGVGFSAISSTTLMHAINVTLLGYEY